MSQGSDVWAATDSLLIGTESEDFLYGIPLYLLGLLKQRSVWFRYQPPADMTLNEGLSAEGVCDNVFSTRNVLDTEVVRGQLRYPSMLTRVQLRFGEYVCQWIIIRPDSKLVAFQPMTEFFTDCPFKGQKLKPMCRILCLGMRERLTRKSDGPSLAFPLWHLRNNCTQPV